MLSTAARLVCTGTIEEKEACIRNALMGIQSTEEEDVVLYVPGRCPPAVPRLVRRPVLSSFLPPGCPLS